MQCSSQRVNYTKPGFSLCLQKRWVLISQWMQHSRTFSSPPPPSLWIITMFPATRDLHLCQPQRLIFRHKRGHGMKTFLGWTERDSSCTLGKEEEEEEKQSSKELPPPFTPFSALEPLPSSSLKHIGPQSVHSNDQAPRITKTITNTKSAVCERGALRPDGL